MATKAPQHIVNSPGAGALAEGEIIRRWASLDWEIKQWSNQHIQPASLNPSPQQQQQQENSALRLKAAIWEILVNHLLPTASNPRGAVSWDVTSGTVKDLSKKAFLFAQSEQPRTAYTTFPSTPYNTFPQFLTPFTPRPDEIDKKVSQLRLQTTALSLKAGIRNNNSNNSSRTTTTTSVSNSKLDEIFKTAIQLQIDLALQTPWWYCDFPNINSIDGTRFNSTTMTTPANVPPPNRLRGGDIVTLVVSPALIKRGDSRGENLGVVRVIAKAEIICGGNMNVGGLGRGVGMTQGVRIRVVKVRGGIKKKEEDEEKGEEDKEEEEEELFGKKSGFRLFDPSTWFLA